MFNETYETIPFLDWEISGFGQRRRGRGRGLGAEPGFQCRHCRGYVHDLPELSGVQNRNHCPYCLWSRHMDLLEAGDRLSACKSVMQPLGLTVKASRNKYGRPGGGELMLIHRCSECGKLSINRVAADDGSERLVEIFHHSIHLDEGTRHALAASGITLLQVEDASLVLSHLQGVMPG